MPKSLNRCVVKLKCLTYILSYTLLFHNLKKIKVPNPINGRKEGLTHKKQLS